MLPHLAESVKTVVWTLSCQHGITYSDLKYVSQGVVFCSPKPQQ